MALRRFLLSLSLIPLFAGAAMACPSCKEAAASSENPELAKGWARSIYLLMWMPYVIFGGVTFAIVRSARRNKGEKA